MSSAEQGASEPSATHGATSPVVTPPEPSGADGEWGADSEFDDLEAEASKIFAAWELPEELRKPTGSVPAAPAPVSTPAPLEPEAAAWSAAEPTGAQELLAPALTDAQLDAASAMLESSLSSAPPPPTAQAVSPPVAAQVDAAQVAPAHVAPAQVAVAPAAVAPAASAFGVPSAAAESVIVAPMTADPIAVAPRAEMPAVVARAPREESTPFELSRPRSSAPPPRPMATTSADMTGELPALPQSSSTRNLLIAGIAAAVLMLLAGGFVLFGSGGAPATAAAVQPPIPAPMPPQPVSAVPVPTPQPVAAPLPAVPAAAAVAAVPPVVAEGVAAVAADAPVADAPVADAPVADAPVADAPVADAPVADAPVPDAPVAAAAEAPPPVVARTRPPRRHRLRVRLAPGNAHLTIDGTAARTPYDGRLPEGEHVLSATLDGHEPVTRTVDLQRDQLVSLRLERSRGRIASSLARPEARARTATTIPRRAHTGSSARTGSGARTGARSGGGARTGGAGGFVTESPY